MKIIPRLFLVAIFLFVVVTPVLAQTPRALYTSEVFQKFDVKLISDIGLILPIIVAWFAIKVAALMHGGQLEDVWKLIAAGMSVLALVRVVDSLETLGIL